MFPMHHVTSRLLTSTGEKNRQLLVTYMYTFTTYYTYSFTTYFFRILVANLHIHIIIFLPSKISRVRDYNSRNQMFSNGPNPIRPGIKAINHTRLRSSKNHIQIKPIKTHVTQASWSSISI